jgi:hypothetical protein
LPRTCFVCRRDRIRAPLLSALLFCSCSSFFLDYNYSLFEFHLMLIFFFIWLLFTYFRRYTTCRRRLAETRTTYSVNCVELSWARASLLNRKGK